MFHMKKHRKIKHGRKCACYCNSGKKYKNCHSISRGQIFRPSDSSTKAIEIQRRKQQGLGRPIISTVIKDMRKITVGDKVYNGRWKTFHDFLLDYLKDILGPEWGSHELQKPLKDRHPILQLYDKVCIFQQKNIKKRGEISSIPSTGAFYTYMWLSYNLYLISHNAELQNNLIKRLKHLDQFCGAYYETYVAATFIKAGFLLEFEDETDPSVRHCEFTATHKESGEKFSVEAKCITRKNFISPNHGSINYDVRIGNLLSDALTKNAENSRIIFIDINLPGSKVKFNSGYLVKLLEKYEMNSAVNSPSLPPAYVFITNHPCHYEIDSREQDPMFFMHGFKIPDFGNRNTTLIDEINSRKKHYLVIALWESVIAHTTIPATFDGEIPEFAFGKTKRRLIIGQKYLLNDEFGNTKEAELQQAIIDDNNNIIGFFCVGDGQFSIGYFKMTEEEIAAYKQHSDTFFGVYKEQPKGIKTPLQAFHFLQKGFQSISKEELLNNLKNHPNYNNFEKKTKDELLEIFCIAMASKLFPDANR